MEITVGACLSAIRNMKVNRCHCANFNEMMGIFAADDFFLFQITGAHVNRNLPYWGTSFDGELVCIWECEIRKMLSSGCRTATTGTTHN